MGRQFYESKTDLCKQESIRKRIETLTGRQLVGPLKPAWRCDYFGTRENRRGERTITSFIEIKCRSHEATKYETLIISWDKIHALFNFASHLGGCDYSPHSNRMVHLVPRIVLVCSFGCGALLWTELHRERISRCKITLGGRRDRNDVHDYERVLHIPMQEFQNLEMLKKSQTKTSFSEWQKETMRH